MDWLAREEKIRGPPKASAGASGSPGTLGSLGWSTAFSLSFVRLLPPSLRGFPFMRSISLAILLTSVPPYSWLAGLILLLSLLAFSNSPLVLHLFPGFMLITWTRFCIRLELKIF